MSDRLAAFARRVQGDRFFLGSALSVFARSERLDEYGLARQLSCPVETLVLLRLCRRPTGDTAAFRADIATIAARFGADAAALAVMVRRADALEAMREAGAAETGTLRAARDQNPPPDEEGEPQ